MLRSFTVPLLYASIVQAIIVSIPIQAPPSAPTISPSLTSFSIEGDRWTDWSGIASWNQFFYNCLDNLQKLTGAPPDIRIGANSEDRTNYNPAVEFAQTIFPESTSVTPYPEVTNTTVGDGYYKTARFLPPHTRVTWEIKDADITLDFIDVGNEPNLYRLNGLRASNYSTTQWIEEWTTFATNVSQTAKMTPSGRTKFRLGSFSGSAHDPPPFSPEVVFRGGVLDSDAGKLATIFSQHRYSGSFCRGNGVLLQDLMTKTSIRSNITIFSPDIAAVKAQGLDYVLGETNSFSCHGAPGVSNTAGAALWTLDYLLFASQAGVSKVYFHEGIGFKYNFLQPVTLTRSIIDGSDLPAPLPPHVQPQYYAAIIASEAIGPSGYSRAVELIVNDAQISGYAFYEDARLVRAIFINLRAFLKGREPSSRTAVHLDFSYDMNSRKTMAVKRLKIGFADDTSGLTWGGRTYETSDARPAGVGVVEKAAIVDELDIAETEIVLVTFH